MAAAVETHTGHATSQEAFEVPPGHATSLAVAATCKDPRHKRYAFLVCFHQVFSKTRAGAATRSSTLSYGLKTALELPTVAAMTLICCLFVALGRWLELPTSSPGGWYSRGR